MDNAVEEAPNSSRLRGREAFRAHVTLALGLALCASAFWFEIGRAERGNSLSWAYVFEWPLLAIFAVYMWWKVLHPGRTRPKKKSQKPPVAPEFEGMLAAWQESQRELEQRQSGENASSRAEDEKEQ